MEGGGVASGHKPSWKNAQKLDRAFAVFQAARVNFFASICAKHALHASASKVSTSTDPGISFLSTLQYELNSASCAVILPNYLCQLVTSFCAIFSQKILSVLFHTLFPTMVTNHT